MRIHRDLDLCRSIECSVRKDARFLHDRIFALQLLRPLKADYFALSALRTLLLPELGNNDLYRVSDDALIERAADLMVSGRIHYHAQPPSLGSGSSANSGSSGAAEPMSASPAFPLARRGPLASSKKTSSAVAVADPPTFPPNTNASAQAATLRTAADQGVPFCEVCEAARQRAKA